MSSDDLHWWATYHDPEQLGTIGNSGWLAGDSLDDAVPCPRCGAAVIYSGNYFCRFLDGSCDWALGERAADVATCEAIEDRWYRHHGAELDLS